MTRYFLPIYLTIYIRDVTVKKFTVALLNSLLYSFYRFVKLDKKIN